MSLPKLYLHYIKDLVEEKTKSIGLSKEYAEQMALLLEKVIEELSKESK